ncbi:hypothetical protein IAT40_002292 [Kwoniella sp. CBS 6097]
MVSIKPLAGLSLLLAFASIQVQGSGSLIRLGLGDHVELFKGFGDVFENPTKGPTQLSFNFDAERCDERQDFKFRIVTHDPAIPPDKWTRKTRQWLFHAVAGCWIRNTEDHLAEFNVTVPADPAAHLDWLVPVKSLDKLKVWSKNATCVRDDGNCPDEDKDDDKFPYLGQKIKDFKLEDDDE